jgi:hypothetical protein
MAIRINLNPTGSEGYLPIVELPDPLADSKKISSTALNWDSKNGEATYYRFLGMQKLKDGSWVYSPKAEKPAAVVTVPAKVALTLEIDGSPDHAPTVYLFRVPPYDVVQHPYYSFPASFLIPVQPSWDENLGKWVAHISFTTADFSSTAISYSATSLLRSNSAVFCAVATQDNGRHFDFDWIRVRLLPAKIQPSKDLDYTRSLLAHEVSNILENFGENLLKIYLPQGELWQDYLDALGITAAIDRGQVFTNVLAMIRDPNIRKVYVDSITRDFFVSSDTVYSSWLEFIAKECPKVLQNVLGAMVAVATRQVSDSQGIRPEVDILAGWPGSLVQLTAQGIKDLMEWLAQKPPKTPVQVIPPELPSALESLKLWGTLLNANEEAYQRIVDEMRELQYAFLQAGRLLPTPIMYFKLPLSEPDPLLSYDFDPEKSPEEQGEEARVVYWFIGRKEDPTTGVVEYLPYLIRKTEQGPAIYQISLPDVTSEDLRRAVEEYYAQMKSQFQALRNEAIQRIQTASIGNQRALMNYVFQSSAQFASVYQFAKDFPSHASQSDIWALLRGYSSWGPGASPFSFLTGRNLPPLPFDAFKAMREIAGQFTSLESYWKEDYYPIVQQAMPLISPKVVDTSDPESAYAAFLLAMGMNQAAQLSFDITEYYKPLSYIPYLLGTWKILNYLGLKNALRQSPKNQIFQLRDTWWQIWWTSIFEIEPGRPVFSNEIFSQLEQGFRRNPESRDVIQLAFDVIRSPDVYRVPLLRSAASNILVWNGIFEDRPEDQGYPLVTTSVILGKILFDHRLTSAFESGIREAIQEISQDSEFGLPEETVENIFAIALKSLSTLSSNPDLLAQEVGASGIKDPEEWALIYQRFTENPEKFAEDLGRSLVQGTFVLPSLDMFESYVREKFIGNITPEQVIEIRKALGFPEDMSLDQVAREFYETALRHIPLQKWQELMVAAPYVPKGTKDLRSVLKTYKSLMKKIIDEAFKKTVAEMKSRYGESSPVDDDRLLAILEANFYGFLFFPEPLSEKIGEFSVYFPFVAQMAHTEQRLAIRLGLSLASLGIGLASLAADLLGQLTR